MAEGNQSDKCPQSSLGAADGPRAPAAPEMEQFHGTISLPSPRLPDTALHWIILKLSPLLAQEHKAGTAAEDK